MVNTLSRLFFGALLAFTLTAQLANASPERWRAEGWKTDFDRKTILFTEILSGGPPRDGIPSIDDPVFAAADTIETLGPKEPVIRLEIGGEARAYPLRILMWHEIVNDTVAGMPVAVTYCPLCNSSIVFSRQIGDRVLDFGTTGKLRNSDLVMYDRQSESWWQQFTGEAIVGGYAGTTLKMLPSRVESFQAFKAAFPKAKVLVPNNPALRPYGRNPYVAYDGRPAPYPFYRGDLPDGIKPMARVIVIRPQSKIPGKPKIVSLAHLRERGALTIGDIVLRWNPGQNSALDAEIIDQGRDIGNVSVLWTSDGQETPVVHDVTFAFVAHAFHPGIDIIGQ